MRKDALVLLLCPALALAWIAFDPLHCGAG
jgi:hypothetical protein